MKKRAFTLIELLTVIAIIGILAGILLPALSRVRERSRVVEARADIAALEMAISNYIQTYGYSPASKTAVADKMINASSSGPTYAEFIGILANTLQGGRGIVFLERQPDGGFVDPWDNAYTIVADTNYDGEVTALGETVYRSAAIWSTAGGADPIKSWSR